MCTCVHTKRVKTYFYTLGKSIFSFILLFHIAHRENYRPTHDFLNEFSIPFTSNYDCGAVGLRVWVWVFRFFTKLSFDKNFPWNQIQSSVYFPVLDKLIFRLFVHHLNFVIIFAIINYNNFEIKENWNNF